MTQPPAAPTLHPKRCETCTDEKCPFKEERWESTWHNDIYYFMRRRGCASHLGTTIADTPQTVDAVAGEIRALQNIVEHQLIGNRHYYEVHRAFESFSEAIALLKDGVERE